MNASIKVSLCITIFGFLTFIICAAVSSGEKESHWIKCDVHAGPCRAAIRTTEVSLEISPKPVKAMQDLTFTVSFAGKKPGVDPYIDLGMPGMNMGRNRVALRPTGESVFEGQGVIVRCPSGRRTWKATVMAPNLGSVEFVFDVIY